MAIYRSPFFHIDIVGQDYTDADCKYMISLWHEPKVGGRRELIAVGLSDNVPLLQSTRNKGNVVESVTRPHDITIPTKSEEEEISGKTIISHGKNY